MAMLVMLRRNQVSTTYDMENQIFASRNAFGVTLRWLRSSPPAAAVGARRCGRNNYIHYLSLFRGIAQYYPCQNLRSGYQYLLRKQYEITGASKLLGEVEAPLALPLKRSLTATEPAKRNKELNRTI